MAEKPIDWRGSSLEDLRDGKIFPTEARRMAGTQLGVLQQGEEPEHWKPFSEVGAGTKELIIDTGDGWFRVLYVAKFPEAVYVLHCFRKKTNATSQQDKRIASERYKAVIRERSGK